MTLLLLSVRFCERRYRFGEALGVADDSKEKAGRVNCRSGVDELRLMDDMGRVSGEGVFREPAEDVRARSSLVVW